MKNRKWPKRMNRNGCKKSKYVVILCVSLHLRLQLFFFKVTEFLEEMCIRHSPDQYLRCYDSPLFFSFGLIFSFLAITHPSHVIGPLTTLVFVIASFHLLHRTSLTHSRLLVCTSSRFHCIPPCSFCFVICSGTFRVSGI